ncbi:MAG: hypothetical protein HRT38_11100 [Alteromonadaceae bacterium]|nr:hypothetical protein [Alteromonadaceae bacterium]
MKIYNLTRQLIVLAILFSLIGCTAKDDAQKLVNKMVETNQEYKPYLVKVKQAYHKELALINTLVEDQESTIKEANKLIQQNAASRAKTEYQLAHSQVELSYFTTLNSIELSLTQFQLQLGAKIEESLNALKQEVFKFETKAQRAKIKMNDNPQDNVLKQKYSEAAAQYFSRLIRFNKIERECLQTITLKVNELRNDYQTELTSTKHKYTSELEQVYTTHSSSLTHSKTADEAGSNPVSEPYQGLTAHFDNLITYTELNRDAAKSLKNYFYVTGFGTESLLVDALTTFSKASFKQLIDPEPVGSKLFDIKNDGKTLLKEITGDIHDNFDKLKDTAKRTFDDIKVDFLKNGKRSLNNFITKTVKKFI